MINTKAPEKMSRGNGFTLVELMITVAIIGILAGIALPAYQSYITRAKLTEAINAGGSCKAPITTAYQSFKTIPNTQPTAALGIDFSCECGVWNNYSAGNNCTKNVGAIFVNRNGVIQIQLLGDIGAGIDNGDRIRIIPRNSLGQTMSAARAAAGSRIYEWTCGVHTNASYTFEKRLLPSSCQA